MDLTSEENINIYAEEIVEGEINAEDLEQNIDTEEFVKTVEVDANDEVEISVGESIGWIGGDSTRHYSLSGRDEPNQHPIGAIAGLRSELDKIKALQTVYSDTVGVANYYKWSSGTYNEVGYFVSLVPQTSMIQICGGDNIFGVTVDVSGFVGGQDGITLDYIDGTITAHGAARDNTYALVSTSGLVDVRCESDVEVGDYVISNAQGVAEKTKTDCGYKVIAVNNKQGVNYASISLGVQACITDAMGQDIQRLTEDMKNANINISAAMNAANEAYNKAGEMIRSNESINSQMKDIIDRVDDALVDVEDIESQMGNVLEMSTQAKAIAESAVTSAETAKNDAVSAATNALDKVNQIEKTVEPINSWEYTNPVTGETHTGAQYLVEYIEDGLLTKAEVETVNKLDEENKLLIEKNAESYSRLLSSVDKYSVGEYSQAYGLTLAQAQSILKGDMVYIPTSNHPETYGENDPYSFSRTFYYVWDGTIWIESIGKVWFGDESPAGDSYEYWYDDNNLYILQNEEWVQVATLAGNVNNRITSMIRQEVDEVSMNIASVGGSVAGINARL